MKLQKAIVHRTVPIFIDHIRAHSYLPGKLSLENSNAVAQAHVVYTFDKARQSLEFFHQNSKFLQKKFKIIRAQAREIVMSCSCWLIPRPIPQQAVVPEVLKPISYGRCISLI